MYLKNINLDEKYVTDRVCLNIFALMTGITEGSVAILRHSSIFLKDHEKRIMVGIRETGLIYAYDYNDGSPIRSDNQCQAEHLLFESQWRDPRVEMPETGEETIGKFYDDSWTVVSEPPSIIIATVKYGSPSLDEDTFQNSHSSYDLDSLIGWLPAENVVL